MIGVFDSGLGGLLVTHTLLRRLPEYSFMYLGDTARVPYGNRSADELYLYTQQGVHFLFSQGCRLVIVACNSASAEALRRLQRDWLPKHFPDRKVLGVIRPMAEVAAQQSQTGRIGVIGTRATIQSGAYERELVALRPDAVVIQKATPLLVPLIEEGWANRPETKRILRTYLRPVLQHNIDTLILGCTHYPYLLPIIRRMVGKRVVVPDPTECIAEKLIDYLIRHPEIDATLTRGQPIRGCLTAPSVVATEYTKRWLDVAIAWEHIQLPE